MTEKSTKAKLADNARLLFVFIVGILMVLYYYYQAHSTEFNCPATTTAQVLSKQFNAASKHYDVTYQFTVNGKTYQGTSKMPPGPNQQPATVLICYDPKDPNDNATTAQ